MLPQRRLPSNRNAQRRQRLLLRQRYSLLRLLRPLLLPYRRLLLLQLRHHFRLLQLPLLLRLNHICQRLL
jgi:hypothetical protein